MPKARARLAPTTSITTAPTTARTICVWTTAGVRGGVPRRFGPQRERRTQACRQRQPHHRVGDVVERMHRVLVGILDRPLWLELLGRLCGNGTRHHHAQEQQGAHGARADRQLAIVEHRVDP